MNGASIKPNRAGDVLANFPELQGLLKKNEEWSGETREQDPALLEGLSKGQVSL